MGDANGPVLKVTEIGGNGILMNPHEAINIVFREMYAAPARALHRYRGCPQFLCLRGPLRTRPRLALWQGV